MPQPSQYLRTYDFTTFQDQYPSQPIPASPLDSELDQISIASGQIVSRIALIQRDDGQLQNSLVNLETLSATVQALLGSTMNPRGAWVTATNYVILDMVTQSGATYLCAVNNLSGTFATDLAAGKWLLFANPTAATGASFFQQASGDGVTTVFATSADLGTDSKGLNIFIDAGAGKGYEIQKPTAYTIAGTVLTFTVAPTNGVNNIYIFAPSTLLGAAGSSAAAAAVSAANAATSETNALNYAQRLFGTSTTNTLIGTGAKAFTTQTNKFFDVGNFLVLASNANAANYMHGQVTAYNAGTGALTVNVIDIGGSGTFNDWNIKVSGTQGAVGAAGTPIPITAGAGTVDAITADFTPDVTLIDKMVVIVTSTGANTITNPTFAPDGLAAKTIVCHGGAALVAGDTGAAGYPMMLEYNFGSTRWELMNPAKVVEGDMVLADVATNNVSTTKHGFMPKLLNNAANFFSDDGTMKVPTAGLNTLYVPIAAQAPSVTGGCAPLAMLASGANQPDIKYLAFDPSTQEYAQFSVRFPKGWNAGTITAAFIWSHAATATNFGVVWNLQGVSIADNEAMAIAYGTAQQVTDTGGTTDKQYISPTTAAITIAGTPAAGEVVYFRASRVAADGADTMTIDARLMGVLLFYTVTTSDDT